MNLDLVYMKKQRNQQSSDPKPQAITEVKESEFAAFKTLWSYMDHRSYLSGLYLRDFYAGPYHLNMFAHVLPKAKNKFPHFRYYMRNIILLTPSEHALLDEGTQEQRESYSKLVPEADWDRIDKLRADLLSEHNSLFPKMQGIIIMRYNKDDVRVVIRKLNAIFLSKIIAGEVRSNAPRAKK